MIMFISLFRPIVLIRVTTQTVTMVLTAAQATAFFERASHVDMPHSTRVKLQSKSMTDPTDLVDSAKESMAMSSQKLRRPGGESKIHILTPLQEPSYRHHISYLELRSRSVS